MPAAIHVVLHTYHLRTVRTAVRTGQTHNNKQNCVLPSLPPPPSHPTRPSTLPDRTHLSSAKSFVRTSHEWAVVSSSRKWSSQPYPGISSSGPRRSVAPAFCAKSVLVRVVIPSWSEMYILVHTRQKHNLIMSATTHTFRVYTFCSRLCKRTIVNVLQHAQRQSQTLDSAMDLRMRSRLPVKSMAHWFRLQVATTATVDVAMTSRCTGFSFLVLNGAR